LQQITKTRQSPFRWVFGAEFGSGFGGTGNIFFFIFRLRFVIYIYGAKIKKKERNTKFFEYTL